MKWLLLSYKNASPEKWCIVSLFTLLIKAAPHLNFEKNLINKSTSNDYYRPPLHLCGNQKSTVIAIFDYPVARDIPVFLMGLPEYIPTLRQTFVCHINHIFFYLKTELGGEPL